MKNPYESAETFTAYATIEAGLYMMSELLKDLMKPQSPLEAMVDRATGFADHKYREQCQRAIDICKDVIEAKKVLEVDYSDDAAMIEDLQKRITNPHQQTENN